MTTTPQLNHFSAARVGRWLASPVQQARRRLGGGKAAGVALVVGLGLGACNDRAAAPSSRPVAATGRAVAAMAGDAGSPRTRLAAAVYSATRPSPDGIGKVYMGREIAQVMGHPGADWLERAEREQEERPNRAIEMLNLRPTDVVADIGAGSGYFSLRIARKVPRGKVLAVDVQPEMLDKIRAAAREAGAENVEPVLGREDDPNLPEGAVDMAIMVDAYHEFEFPREMMEAIVKALRPGGRVVDLEYRGEDPDVPIKRLHKMTEAQVIREMEAVGLKHVRTLSDLPRQHLLVFEKPGAHPPRRAGEPGGGS